MKDKNSEVKKEEKKQKENKNNIFTKKTKMGNYISFEDRVILYGILILVFVVASIIFLSKSLSLTNEERITYQEKSNIDYKVHLKKNDFYETEYLDKNMVYVASLIKSIDVDFNYLFDIERKNSIEFVYDIIGKLVITDKDGKNTFFQKEYKLLDKQIENKEVERQYSITKRVSIDYDYYNNLANRFRSNYGIDTNSNLIVELRIYQKSNKSSSFDIDNNSTMSLTIPLSEKAINIKMDYKAVNKDSQVFSNSGIAIDNYLYIFISVILMVLAILFVVLLVKFLLNHKVTKTAYDKYINKLLKEYDRLIVETTTAPNTKDSEIININSFNELLDVRDNLNLPIKYYIIAKHQKCNFYITHGKELYLLVIKAVDLEN